MRYFAIALILLPVIAAKAQTLSARSNELIVDFSDPRNDHSVSMSTITWSTPVDTLTVISGDKLVVSAEVKSIYGLLSAKLRVKERKTTKVLNEFKIPIDDDNKNNFRIERNLTLLKGEIEIEILIENLEGFFVKSSRFVVVNSAKTK